MPPTQLDRTNLPPVPNSRRVLRLTHVAAALLAVPGFLPALAHAQLTGVAAQPTRLDAPWGLRVAPQLEEHALPSGASPAVFGLGEVASGTADRDASLEGSAELRRYTSVIKADSIHYDVDTDLVDAFGNVHIVNNGNAFAGPDAHLKVGASEGYITRPKYHFNLTGGSGAAERIDIIDDARSVVHRGTYTGCPCDSDPAWYVRATQFDIDTDANLGVAHNGVLFFQRVPIFASPWLSFPLSGGRQSGLLPPTGTMSSTTGFEMSLPYYFNLAPNYDLTLTPRIMSRRGVLIAPSFRYLSPTYSGNLTVEYLPYDRITHTKRYAVFFNHSQNFGNGFGGYIYYNRVSDKTYPEDLASGNSFLLGMQMLYQQEIGLTYNSGPWAALLREQHWQTLPPSTAPYGREPQLNVKYSRYNVGGLDFGAEVDATRFSITTADATEGTRFVFNPYVSYPILRPGYFFTPKVQWHFTSYDLSTIGADAPGSQPKRFNVSVPTLSLDSGLVFDRSLRLFGQDYIQTLEPRLYYVYTPYRNQQFAPLFDTAEADFGLAEIFTANSFVGNDRVADANRLTAALTSRFIDAASGDERARFVIAQQYYFRNQRVTFTPSQPVSQAAHSDVIIGSSFKLGDGFATEQAFQYNQNNNQLVRTNLGFSWSPAERRVLNAAYRYTRSNTTLSYEPINQLVISAQWPLARRLYGVGRVNYDLVRHRLVDALAGFEYDAQCWSFGIGLQKYANGVNSSNQPSTGTRMLAQLQLKGFATIDNGLGPQFRASVPGYQPVPPLPAPQARFTHYQ
ncbi:LPS-assembly protein LptD [Mycetohabitans sp. B5]|uniref:LPS-assembly protein LptD n=1 Tax=Mycetohabitans endofungorum TaxID=417203 RepID=A0A2P5KCW1_9BURK|nr:MULTISPECIES: LPS-assembly protein LptD [Mycetohabitans]MCG1055673.1 LPS-assembly protein LptD [Mycetohabitans sp. B5]PPB84540.1 LPS-assembly protein [Mycetohabitans endofungorum]